MSNRGCCECVRSMRDRISLELDSIWTALRRLENNARLSSLVHRLYDRLIHVLVTFSLVIFPAIFCIVIEYFLQDTKDQQVKRCGRAIAAFLIGLGSLVGVPLFLINVEEYLQERSIVRDLLPPPPPTPADRQDQGAAGDRQSTEEDWSDTEEEWSTVDGSDLTEGGDAIQLDNPPEENE